MTISKSQVEAFAALFSGYSKAYGQLSGPFYIDEKGKVVGKNRTVTGTAEYKHFEEHLKGIGPTLGIIALRDDNTALFGAIDWDNRSMDHVATEAKLRELKIPLIMCKSKSGGAHFYCFFSEPVPTPLLQERLAEWVAALGMAANTEIFPKQTSRLNDTDSGTYLNLPYYNAEDLNNPTPEIGKSPRVAFINGKPVDLDTFINAAQRSKLSLEKLQKKFDQFKSQLFDEGPPCLQHYEKIGGFAEGSRNNGMVNVVVYLKKKFPDDWRSRADEYNEALAHLGSDEVAHIKKSIAKKDYRYTCRQAPINSVCQRKTCLKRSFGIGSGEEDEDGGRQYDINALTRYDHGEGEEPVWTMEIAGKRIQVTTSQFYSLDEFNKSCVSQISILPMPNMTPIRWRKHLSTLIPTADVILMPNEASPTGQLWEWILKFCTQKVYAVKKEDIFLGGKPYRDGDVVYFRLFDLFTFLERHKVNYKNEQFVAQLLHRRGADKTFWNIKQGSTNVWFLSVPLPESEEEVRLRKVSGGGVVGEIKPSEDF